MLRDNPPRNVFDNIEKSEHQKRLDDYDHTVSGHMEGGVTNKNKITSDELRALEEFEEAVIHAAAFHNDIELRLPDPYF